LVMSSSAPSTICISFYVRRAQDAKVNQPTVSTSIRVLTQAALDTAL